MWKLGSCVSSPLTVVYCAYNFLERVPSLDDARVQWRFSGGFCELDAGSCDPPSPPLHHHHLAASDSAALAALSTSRSSKSGFCAHCGPTDGAFPFATNATGLQHTALWSGLPRLAVDENSGGPDDRTFGLDDAFVFSSRSQVISLRICGVSRRGRGWRRRPRV